MTHATTLKPISLFKATLWFAGFALLFVIAIHLFLPILEATTLTNFEAFAVATIAPLAIMLALAIALYFQDGHPATLAAFKERYRLQRITWRDFAWTLAILVVGGLGYGAVAQFINTPLIESGLIPLPNNIPPLINPLVPMTPAIMEASIEAPLVGNWGIIVLYALMLFFNIAGEELFWRGYLLPRQEAQHGRSAWIWHGLLWAFFHIFKWWDVLPLIPICLSIAYVSQRTKSTWPALIAHSIFNGMGLIGVLLWVMG